jgi:hypothetical protein
VEDEPNHTLKRGEACSSINHSILSAYRCLPAVRIRAGIFNKSLGARHRVGIGFSYRPARLHRLAEFIPWNRFLGSINV